MRELIYDLIVWIFLIELSVLLLFLILIPVHRYYLAYRTKRKNNDEKEISEILHKALDGNQPALKKFAGTLVLLSVLERFDHRLSGNPWNQVKDQVTTAYLLPYARKKTDSYFWVNRNFAARVFALTPLAADRKAICTLCHDPVFLVRSVAAIAICRMEDKKGILELISRMSKEKGYAFYFYRDLLVQSSNKDAEWVKEIARTEKNPGIHRVCLDILSERTFTEIPPYLKEDLQSQNTMIRLAATKILANNPKEAALPMLIKCLDDPHPEVRREAVSGLKHFPTPPVFKRLEEMMQDDNWLVRLRTAQVLKKMGDPGVQILKNRPECDASTVVLQADWEE